MEYRDVTGQFLEVGDVIAYGVASSGHIAMALGIIVGRGETGPGLYREPRPALRVLRTAARRPGGGALKVTGATLTELQRVVKIHPAYYNEVVAQLQAAVEPQP